MNCTGHTAYRTTVFCPNDFTLKQFLEHIAAQGPGLDASEIALSPDFNDYSTHQMIFREAQLESPLSSLRLEYVTRPVHIVLKQNHVEKSSDDNFSQDVIQKDMSTGLTHVAHVANVANVDNVDSIPNLVYADAIHSSCLWVNTSQDERQYCDFSIDMSIRLSCSWEKMSQHEQDTVRGIFGCDTKTSHASIVDLLCVDDSVSLYRLNLASSFLRVIEDRLAQLNKKDAQTQLPCTIQVILEMPYERHPLVFKDLDATENFAYFKKMLRSKHLDTDAYDFYSSHGIRIIDDENILGRMSQDGKLYITLKCK